MLELFRRINNDYSSNYYWAVRWEAKRLGLTPEEVEKILEGFNVMLREVLEQKHAIGNYDPVYDEHDGTTCTRKNVIEFRTPPRSLQAVQVLADYYWPMTYCTHEYDCCAHWYSDWPRVRQISPTVFEVTQRSYQNV